MAVTYERFKKLGLDTSCLSMGRCEAEPAYFCTPKGAKAFGAAGVDGIHFCFVKGFGETVFAVSPMNLPGDYVHPLAESFEDFLRLLLACGDTAALEQAHGWTPEQFDRFLRENPFTPEQRAVLDAMAEKLKLTPMEQPFSYLRELQSAFDYSRIPFTGDTAEWAPVEPKLPEWKVRFEGSFWGRDGSGSAGVEIAVRKEFAWAGRTWQIPAVYSMARGLVVDLCMRTPQAQLRAFVEKWKLSPERDGSDLSDEQRMLADAENPLRADFRTQVAVNGRTLRESHGCGECWNPCFPEQNSIEARAALARYALDADDGWTIHRVSLPWATKRRPRIRTLAVRLEQEPVALPGMHFRASVPGEQIRFTHPLTKAEHILTVQECERQELPPMAFSDSDCRYPTHYMAMRYIVTPELAMGELSLADCAGSDRPQQKNTDPFAPEATSDCCVGIIGGADGPTEIFVAGDSRSRVRTACSSLHFEPIDDVEWRMVFYEKTADDMEIVLLE